MWHDRLLLMLLKKRVTLFLIMFLICKFVLALYISELIFVDVGFVFQHINMLSLCFDL